jgi:hypothetical protein
MALGVVPVVSDVGGLRELTGSNGLCASLVSVTGNRSIDSEGFADAIRFLLYNKERRDAMSEEAIARVQSVFDASTKVPALVDRILSTPRRVDRHVGNRNDIADVYYALDTVVQDIGLFSDYHFTLQSLRGKERNGFGARYKEICGERSSEDTALIDMLESPRSCQRGLTLNIPRIQQLALAQCGQWCIMDTDDSSRSQGWQFVNLCMSFFNDSTSACAKWYRTQPRT